MTPSMAVFTAVFGDTDELRDPVIVAPNVRYYCASDRPVDSRVWRHLNFLATSASVLDARHFKLGLGARIEARRVDAYLWIDAAYQLQVDPTILLPHLLRADLAVLPHPARDTIAAEAQEIVKLGLAESHDVSRQLMFYQQDGYPDTRLSSTGFLLRRNDARTHRFNEHWLVEFSTSGHTRDQLSFNYTAWKQGLVIHDLEGHYRDNPYADWDGRRRPRRTP